MVADGVCADKWAALETQILSAVCVCVFVNGTQ